LIISDGLLVITASGSTLSFDSYNLAAESVQLASASAVTASVNGSTATLATSLGNDGVAMCSGGGSCSLAAVVTALEASGSAQQAIYAKYNTADQPEGAKVRQAIEAAVMWNMIYVPAEAGPFAPVSRGWSFAPGAINSDFNYVIFDWDNIFAAYMFGALGEETAKHSAYSSIIQVLRSKTKHGFVPNYSAAGSKSQDRSEEIIGSKVLLEIYKQYKEEWIVELLFDDCLDWLNWAHEQRTLPPLNLITQGSDNITGVDGLLQPDGSMW
jgi:hypothetical protein